MANNIAFQPMGKTVKIIAGTAAVNNANVVADSPSNQYCLVNHTSQPAYVWISPGDNPVNVALPTGSNSNSAYAMIVDKNARIVITGPQCSSSKPVQVSVIAETDSPEVYITPGEGLA
jgi:hypothetical protein